MLPHSRILIPTLESQSNAIVMMKCYNRMRPTSSILRNTGEASCMRDGQNRPELKLKQRLRLQELKLKLMLSLNKP
jgi:hypothetical protein